MGKTPRKPLRSNSSIRPARGTAKGPHTNQAVSMEAFKAAERMALAAFGSGLKVAAAFGTVAAKTTSMALASLATGADKFSEMVKKEALDSSKAGYRTERRKKRASGRGKSRARKV